MPNPNQPRRPNQSPLDFGGRLLGRLGDEIQGGMSDAKDWVDDRVADAKGAAIDMATRLPPIANTMSKLPPPFGVNDGDSNPRPPAPPMPAADDDITLLSRMHEPGRLGPGTVTHANGDYGGGSYGTYQFSSKWGIPDRFLNTYGAKWKPRFQGKPTGSLPYDDTWKAIAREEPEEFEKKQTEFIANDYFKTQADLIRRQTGFDIGKRSLALRRVVFSTAVQHGENNSIVSGVILALRKAHPGQEPSDAEIIKGVYTERGREDAKGGLVHFHHSPKLWRGLKARFPAERDEALDMLDKEGR